MDEWTYKEIVQINDKLLYLFDVLKNNKLIDDKEDGKETEKEKVN